MKKCPECGNPSYDGAPVCGNCGYKFPKQKVVAPKSEDIFQQEPKVKKDANDEDTISIIKNNKLIIGAIEYRCFDIERVGRKINKKEPYEIRCRTSFSILCLQNKASINFDCTRYDACNSMERKI